jgi:hypothetical protein
MKPAYFLMWNMSVFMEVTEKSIYSSEACGQAGCPVVFALVESNSGG